MITVNDWLRSVSDVLKTHADADIETVFREHSPFKIDVAYMPVPRCDGCKYWEKRVIPAGLLGNSVPSTDLDVDEGICRLANQFDAKAHPDMYDALITTSDFGCTEYEHE